MSLWRIAWSYLWNRKFTTILTIFSVALGVGLITTVLTLRRETQRRFEEEGQTFDLVVGPKGEPLQLVLSAVYYLDRPVGTIDIDVYERLKLEDEVAGAYPIGLGDSYKGFRIVGTVPELFDYVPVMRGETLLKVQEGRRFEKSMEIVLGAMVARETEKKIGDKIIGSHGFVDGAPGSKIHEGEPYTIVGILEPSGTPNDRVLFTSLDSVWDVHAHGDEEDHEEAEEEEGQHHAAKDRVSAILVALRSPADRLRVAPRINNVYNAQAAVPVEVIAKLYDQFLGVAKAVLLAIGYLVVAISSLTILIGLYLSILQRKKDLAIMRALGASAGEIFGSVIIEAFWVTVLGMASGWVLGSVVSWAIGQYLKYTIGFSVPLFVSDPDLVSALSAVLLMGMIAGILPAWQAYRTDVARDLAEL